jgi:hypothetical protein
MCAERDSLIKITYKGINILETNDIYFFSIISSTLIKGNFHLYMPNLYSTGNSFLDMNKVFKYSFFSKENLEKIVQKDIQTLEEKYKDIFFNPLAAVSLYEDSDCRVNSFYGANCEDYLDIYSPIKDYKKFLNEIFKEYSKSFILNPGAIVLYKFLTYYDYQENGFMDLFKTILRHIIDLHIELEEFFPEKEDLSNFLFALKSILRSHYSIERTSILNPFYFDKYSEFIDEDCLIEPLINDYKEMIDRIEKILVTWDYSNKNNNSSNIKKNILLKKCFYRKRNFGVKLLFSGYLTLISKEELKNFFINIKINEKVNLLTMEGLILKKKELNLSPLEVAEIRLKQTIATQSIGGLRKTIQARANSLEKMNDFKFKNLPFEEAISSFKYKDGGTVLEKKAFGQNLLDTPLNKVPGNLERISPASLEESLIATFSKEIWKMEKDFKGKMVRPFNLHPESIKNFGNEGKHFDSKIDFYFVKNPEEFKNKFKGEILCGLEIKGKKPDVLLKNVSVLNKSNLEIPYSRNKNFILSVPKKEVITEQLINLNKLKVIERQIAVFLDILKKNDLLVLKELRNLLLTATTENEFNLIYEEFFSKNEILMSILPIFVYFPELESSKIISGEESLRSKLENISLTPSKEKKHFSKIVEVLTDEILEDNFKSQGIEEVSKELIKIVEEIL